MADYYPLISRAIANLGESDPAARRALYERATNALLGQLRNSDPPITEAEISHERLSLEDAIRRVETQVAGGMPLADEAVRQGNLQEAPPDAGEVGSEPRPREDEPPAAERPRPPAPRVEGGDGRWLRAAVIGSAIALVVGLTAGTAIMLKHEPSEFAVAPQATLANPAEQERKAQDRLPGDGTAAVSDAAPAGAPRDTTTGAPTTPAPAGPALGVLQRALLVEEAAQEGGELRQTQGKVLWRLDSVSAGAGEPLDAAVRAVVDLSDSGVKADLLIRRNRDAALPASHTLELKFSGGDTAPNGRVRDVGVPEMRQEETARGTPLAGIAVPVTENLFLIGLSNLPIDIARNLDLIRTRNWFMMPLRFTSGKRAILLFEKGTPGDRAIGDALQAWK
jgi:hypothetical protein